MRGPDCKACQQERQAASRGCSGSPEYRALHDSMKPIPFGGRVVDGKPIPGAPDLLLRSCAGTVEHDRDLAPLIERWGMRRTLGVHPGVAEFEGLSCRDARAWAVLEAEFSRVEGFEQAAAYDRAERKAKGAGHAHR